MRRWLMGQMLRLVSALALFFIALPLFAQVQSVGDVSFAVPDGWKYQAGSDFGAMVLTADQNFWLLAVYTPMPTPSAPSRRSSTPRTVTTSSGMQS